MIVYKVDEDTHNKANAQIRDLAPVLAEVSPTMQVLKDAVITQGRAMSTPSIDGYRAQLLKKIDDVVTLAKQIMEDSKKLVAVSDQAGKHLQAVEEHFDAMLKDSEAPAVQRQAAEEPAKKARVLV